MESELYRNEEKTHMAQRDFVTYIKEATYWQKTKLIGSMLNFLVIVFVILILSLEDYTKVYKQILPIFARHQSNTFFIL